MIRTADIAIVGAGPAGCAAAVQCRRRGVTPLLLDRTGEPGGLIVNAWRIENYPGLEPVDGPAFAAGLAEHLTRFDLSITPAEVTRIDVGDDGFILHFLDDAIAARAVIAATGTRAVRLDLPGAVDLEGTELFYEVVELMRARPRPGRIVVIGGGEAALDYSLSLAGRGVAVTLLIRGSGYRACRRLIEAVQAEPRIETLFGIAPRELRADGEAVVVAVTDTSTGGSVPVRGDGVVAAIGREPTIAELLPGLDLGTAPGMMTAVPGLYVAGDARLGSLGQAGIAVGDGLAAARGAVGWIGRMSGE